MSLANQLGTLGLAFWMGATIQPLGRAWVLVPLALTVAAFVLSLRDYRRAKGSQ
jgi:hypothetical protein